MNNPFFKDACKTGRRMVIGTLLLGFVYTIVGTVLSLAALVGGVYGILWCLREFGIV